MRKTFQLTHPKIKYPRMIEAVKHEVRKYLKRNRKKTLPEGVDFWDFACKYGDTEAEAKVIHLSEVDKHINDAEKRELEELYLEIIPTPGHRQKKEEE